MVKLDDRTLGRWPPRASQMAMVQAEKRFEDVPLFYFFDGKSFTPYNNRRGADLYSGYGAFTAATLRPGRLIQSDWDFARAYVQCEYAFRAVEMVASDIAAIEHGVRNKITQKDWPDHPLMQALTWARRMNQQDILSLWQKALYVFGETYLLPVSNGFRDPTTHRLHYNGLQWLNPLVTEPVIMYGQLTSYDYTAYGMDHFKPGEIVHDKVPSMFDDIRGQSRISAALAAINIDIEIKRYTLDSFLKDMRMSGILTGAPGSNLTQFDVDTAMAIIKEKRESRLIALAPSLVWQTVQHEWNNTQFAASDDARRRITTALGIPMSVVGAWDDAKYQSAPAQLAFYYDHVVFRECDRLTEFINDVLMPYFDPAGEGEWYYDRDSVMTLIEDKATKTSMINSRQAAGNLSLNEARLAMGNAPIEGGDVFILNGQLVQKSALALMAQQQQPLLPDVPQLPAPVAPKAVEPVEQPGMKSAAFMLACPNHPDLITLQNRVKQYVGEILCEWNDPASFHVTMVYMPVVTDEQLAALTEALAEVEMPDLALNVGSLSVFDTGTNYAVHFRLRRNAALYDLQEELHSLCESLGIPMSSYSEPQAYKPHITMGYATEKPPARTFQSKLMVKPAELVLGVGDEVIWRTGQDSTQKVIEQQADANILLNELQADGIELTGYGLLKTVEPETIHAAALDELAAWQKHVRNKGAVKAVDFQNYLIRDDVTAFIRREMRLTEQLATDEAARKASIKAIFEKAGELVSVKAIQATRIDFEDAFTDVLNDAVAGKLTRRQFQGRLNSLLELNIYKAFVDGLADGGVDDPPDEEDMQSVNNLIADQRTYVSGLGSTLYRTEETISDAMKEQKPAMWYNGSIAPAYSAGLLSADANSMFVWHLGQTEEHCLAQGGKWGCATLDGTSKRYKTWNKLNLVAGTVGQDTTCGGFRCECKLVRKAGKSSSIDLTTLELDRGHIQ